MRLLALLTVCAALLYATCARAEVWTEFEQAVGKLTFDEMSAREGLLQDPLLQCWLNRVGGDIARQSNREYLHYRFYIVNTDESNAFSLPGGYVMVTAGLLNHVTSDEELAGVLGHELAHSDDRDFARVLRQQLLFFGLQASLRGKISDGWIIASQFLQIFETMRRSRAHEAQADYNGTLITFRACYDPQGIVDFLQTIPSRDTGLDRLTASHPCGSARVQSAQARVRDLQGAHYDYLMALAASLQARHHLRRAAATAQMAADRFPCEADPLLLAGRIEEQRGDLTPARLAYQQALAREPQCAEAAAALQRLAGVEPPEGQPVVLPETLRQQVEGTVAELRRDEAALNEAEQTLRKRLGQFDSDRQIAEGLQAAQLLAPELGDAKYMSTLARAYWVLSRAQQEAHREGEVLARGASVRLGWERVACDLTADKVSTPVEEKYREAQSAELQLQAQAFLQHARPAVQAATAQVRLTADNCAQLTTATRQLSVAFLALVASGPHQPLGSINYARFLLLQSDIAVAETRVKKAEGVSDKALRAIFEEHLRVTQVAIDTLHATAAQPLRELDLALLAERLGTKPEALAQAAQCAPLGEAACALLDKSVTVKGLGALQVKDCLLRIGYLDLFAERATGAPKAAIQHYAAAPATPALPVAEIPR